MPPSLQKTKNPPPAPEGGHQEPENTPAVESYDPALDDISAMQEGYGNQAAVQFRRGSAGGTSEPSDPAERQAEQVAQGVAAGDPGATGELMAMPARADAAIHRKEDSPEENAEGEEEEDDATVLEQIQDLLEYGIFDWAITDAEAREVLTILKGLSADQRGRVIASMRQNGHLERLLDNAARADRAAFSVVLEAMPIEDRLRILLSYGLLDWAITDAEARECVQMLQAAPPESRAAGLAWMKENGYLRRFFSNVALEDAGVFRSLMELLTDEERIELVAGLSDDPSLFIRTCTLLDQAQRQVVILHVRSQPGWEDLLAALGAEDAVLVQSWLDEDEGDDTDDTLQERIDAAHNSDRGRDALTRVDAVAATDTNTPARITGRIRELLVLGVALPKLEGNDLASEGVLGAVQAERAAQALVAMPLQEYLRTAILLELSGDTSRLNQSFLVLKAVAARLDQFNNTDEDDDSLGELEGFSDAIRDMNDQDVIDNTSVVQTQAGGDAGLTQRYTMSCNVTSAVAVRAEADPIEALHINQQDELGVDQLQGQVAAETEEGLENHAGNVAVARDTSRVVDAVNNAITALAGTVPATQLQAVQRYLARQPYDANEYAAGITAIRNHIGQSGFPDDQAMRLVREADPTASQPGLTPQQLRTEMNDTLEVDEVTGQTAAVDWDATLWGLYTADNDGDGVADRQLPTPVPAAWTTRVAAMLGRAEQKLEQGIDVTFNVYWHGGGGHTMSFSNVRTVAGAREFLVHDTWTGTTAWVPESSIQQGNWPGISGNRGLICGLIG